MREIKFRAWDVVSETMIYSTEEEVVFLLENGEWSVKYIREKNLVKDGIEIDAPVWQESDEVEIMLSSGQTDKNGVEIYEGDICVINPDDDSHRDVVVRDKNFIELSGYKNRCVTNCSLYENPDAIKVVGNIYENPIPKD